MLHLETISPGRAGIPARCILRFLDRLEEKGVPMHSIQLLYRGRLLAEGYYAPYTAHTPHRMFSISKSLTALAIGFLEQDGRLSLSDPIVSYFPDLVPADVHPWIRDMTIRDMLMMRTCHASTTYKLDLKSNWVASFFTTPPTHPPGMLFHYDTSSAHTLCALAERLTERPMLDYLKEKLSVLGLSENSYMLKDPFGVSLGGSGLVCEPADLRKLACFIARRGKVGGEQILNAQFLETATSCLTSTRMTAPLPSEACGYGYQFWCGPRGGYTCYGMGGQLMIFLPGQDLICITTADTQGMAGGNQLIYDALYEEILPHLSVKDCYSEDDLLLQERLSSLRMQPLKKGPDPAKTDLPPMPGKDYSAYAGDWTFAENPEGFSGMSLAFSSDLEHRPCGRLTLRRKGVLYPLEFGLGHLCCGVFPVYGQNYAASGIFEDDATLYLKFHIIDEYVGSVHIELAFAGDLLTVFLKKQEESLFQEFRGHLVGHRTGRAPDCLTTGCAPVSEPTIANNNRQ